MKIRLLFTGRTDDAWVKDGSGVYLRRLSHYCTTEVEEIPAVKAGAKTDAAALKKAEALVQLRRVEPGDLLVLLDENGKQFSSVELAAWLGQQQMRSVKRLVFLIGGAFGFDESVYRRADEKISLSRLTFSHQLVRLVFAEQLYRAFTITRGEKYHHS